MQGYDMIEAETAMSGSTIYRMTPYEFALTAEPRQFTIKIGPATIPSHVMTPHHSPVFGDESPVDVHEQRMIL